MNNYNYEKFDKKYKELIIKVGSINPTSQDPNHINDLMVSREILIAIITGKSNLYNLPQNTSVGFILMCIDDLMLVRAGKHEDIKEVI